MLSLIYVSRSRIVAVHRTTTLDDIQAVSVAHNSQHDITGLLIAGPEHFAQLLEGPRRAVDTVMARIAVDPRHYDVRIVRHVEVNERKCSFWRMVRFDGENFAAVSVSPILAGAHDVPDRDSLRELDRLVDEFTRTQIPPSVPVQRSQG